MTMLSDFFIATPSEVEGLDLNVSPALDRPSMLARGLSVRHLRGLCAACSTQVTNEDQRLALLPNHECAATSFPCILKLPQAAVRLNRRRHFPACEFLSRVREIEAARRPPNQ